jgi:hypothetical protein
MKSLLVVPFFAILISLLLSFSAYAHSCNGLKSAHCSCNASGEGHLFAQATNHSQCYNQQLNTLPTSNCAMWCDQTRHTFTTAIDAGLKSRNLCGERKVYFKYSAGTNVPTVFWMLKWTSFVCSDKK